MFDRIKGAITGELHIKVGGVAYILLGTLLGTVASIVH